MIQRSDISNKLIHFTRGKTYNDAFDTLIKILQEKRLIGGTGMIRGWYNCVCLTEAPLPAISEIFADPILFTRYMPFGVMFDKSWVYSQGGLPVIYQPESDFNLLDEKIRWRHVRYEPNNSTPIDFTWEREWRIQRKELFFTSAEAVIVLPNTNWVEYLLEIHHKEQEWVIQTYSSIFSDEIVAQFVKEFQWRIITLADTA